MKPPLLRTGRPTYPPSAKLSHTDFGVRGRVGESSLKGEAGKKNGLNFPDGGDPPSIRSTGVFFASVST